MTQTSFKDIPGYEFLNGHPISFNFEIYEDGPSLQETTLTGNSVFMQEV